MSVKWKNHYNPQLLIDEILSLRVIEKTGKVGFRGWGIERVASVLSSAIDPDQNIPEIDWLSIQSKAIFSAIKVKNLTTKRLLSEINKKISDYKARPLKDFIFISSLSLKLPVKHIQRRLIDTNISLSQTYPEQYDRSTIQDRIDRLGHKKSEEQFTNVKIRLKARTAESAFSVGLNALDLLRGFWNLYLNTTRFRISMMQSEPVNKVRTGRIHTIHKINGTLGSHTIWYEPVFYSAVDLSITSDKLNKLTLFERIVRKNLQNNPYKEFLEESIIQYSRALDEKILQNSFIKLWTLLERLTGSLKENYNVTIKRVVFPYQKRDAEKQVLEHLRDNRNNIVHLSQNSAQAESLVYLLHEYVRQQLLFLIKELKTFPNIGDCWKFLDQPYKIEDLRIRLKYTKRAIKWKNKINNP